MVPCTIAIPVYNRRSPALNQIALKSALAQPLPNLEILVVDDCSTDGTWEILQTYHDARLRLVRNEHNMGLFGNFNRCLCLAQGKYLRILCSDDKLAAGSLNREIEIMEAHPNVAVLSTRGIRLDETGHVLGAQAGQFRPGIYDGQQAIHAVLWFHVHYAYNPLNYPSGVLLRREDVLRAGGFDTRLRMLGDVDLFLRVLEQKDLAVLDTVGCEITIHSGQEGVRLVGDTAPLRELSAIAKRYEPLLRRKGSYNRIMAQLNAYALGLAFKCWRKGMRREGRLHLQIARSNRAHLAPTVVAVGRLLGLRLLLKLAGFRSVPAQPIGPLGGAIVR